MPKRREDADARCDALMRVARRAASVILMRARARRAFTRARARYAMRAALLRSATGAMPVADTVAITPVLFSLSPLFSPAVFITPSACAIRCLLSALAIIAIAIGQPLTLSLITRYY
jgi:hypothetical protein